VFAINPAVAIEVNTRLNEFFRAIEDGAFDLDAVPAEVELPVITLLGDDPQLVDVGTEYTELGAAAFDAAGENISDEIVIDASSVDVSTPGSYQVTYNVADSSGNAALELVRSVVVVDPEASTTTSSTTTTTTQPPTTTTTLPPRPLSEQIEDIQVAFPLYGQSAVAFVEEFNADIQRAVEGERLVYPDMRSAVLARASAEMEAGIKTGELEGQQNDLILNPPFIPLPGLENEEQSLVRQAVGNVIAQTLQPNEFVDEVETEQRSEAAAAAVDPVRVLYFSGDVITVEGQPVTAVQLDAVNQLGLLEPEEVTSRRAIAVLGGLAVLLAAFFLWRVAPDRWSQPRHFALLGIILVLAAAASRVPEVIVTQDNMAIAYILPAVMFGYMGAILYDPRTALLLSIPVATFTAISTNDPALTVYAAGATVVPVAFVSAVSSRRQLRVAVGLTALVLAPLAAAIAWLFSGSDEALAAAIFGVGGGVIGGLVGQGILSFLENTFRMTTTLTLLDLTDRNHPGLRLLEEKAPGTFNHSILVGTLAGKAARAIGADPLLAQAAAYYHDLGKTENPQYFIENQFGVSNPHDEIDPVQSAQIIRSHVTDGLRLARQLRIPETVADGIRMHHGTGLMRYFYHQALESDPTIDPADYRHGGEKPRRKEMAILMLSDAVEGAARALAQQEDPTAASLSKMVDSIVGEKLEDGQLDESELTFGDLTLVKQALVDALIGYYHTRIPYPGFPGSAVVDR